MSIFSKIGNRFRRKSGPAKLQMRQLGDSVTGSFHAFPQDGFLPDTVVTSDSRCVSRDNVVSSNDSYSSDTTTSDSTSSCD